MNNVFLEQIAEEVTELIYMKDPDLTLKYGEKGRRKCVEDNIHHLKHLETAWQLKDERFFIDYAVWLDGILKKFGMQSSLLIMNFELLSSYFMEEKEIAKEEADAYISYLSKASGRLAAGIEAEEDK
ncbi:hypothetical protein ACFVHQ_08785 [Actinomycetes bacterium NPDC127524]